MPKKTVKPKHSKASAASTSKKLEAKKSINTNMANVRKKAQQSAANVAASASDAISWIQARPAAVRNWKQEDKKKKKYRSFRLQKKIKPEPRYIPSGVSLLKESFKFLYKYKKIFLTIALIHALIYVAIIRSPITTDVGTIKSTVESVLGETDGLSANVATLGAVIGTTGGSQANATLASVTVAAMSLVYIWATRQLQAGKFIKARDAYYQAMTPLASGFIVLVVASLQLIPFAVASFVYATARSNGLFASGFEDLAFFVVTVLTSLLSFYWMTSTIIGLYIVTLPGMYPLRALRAAKKLVQFQRLLVFRRILALPVILGITYVLFLLLSIRFISSQVFILVEILQILVLPLVHVYLYKLYRALI